MTERIGFVGVGRMGSNMARRLKDCGYPVTAVYDVRKEAAAALAQELGCRVATTSSEVTDAADVIVTVVTDDKAMAKIFTSGKGGLLRNASGKLFINCATVSPEAGSAWRPASEHQLVKARQSAAYARRVFGALASAA